MGGSACVSDWVREWVKRKKREGEVDGGVEREKKRVGEGNGE